MEAHLLKADKNINLKTGFKCERVYLKTVEPYSPHYHEFYELFITLSDGVVHIINDEEDILPRGALIFIRKADRHFYKPNCNNECAFVNIAVTEEIIEDLFSFFSDSFPSEKLLNEKNPPKVILDPIGVKKIMTELDIINTIPIDEHHKRSLGYKKLMVSIFSKYFADYSFDKTIREIPFWLKDFDIKMKKIEFFSCPSDEIVKLSGKSREHLSRSIRKYYNVSFSDYVNDIRLNYVANSLLDTDLSITDLFYDAGFENLSYAYVLFKRKFNVTPKMMRESANKL